MIPPREDIPVLSAVDAAVQHSASERGLVPLKQVGPKWAVITKEGPDSSPDYFEWALVEINKEGKWERVDQLVDAIPSFRSFIASDASGNPKLLNPAVEVNGRAAPVGSIVLLHPYRQIIDTTKGAGGQYTDSFLHRFWLFTVAGETLRPFKLTKTIIPAGGPGADTGKEGDFTVEAEWLDLSSAEGPPSTAELSVTLYPAHQSGWPSGDQFISLGVGRGPSTYFRGTYGWARWEAQATIEELDDNGDPVWRGEWQIVTLYADLIQQVRVYDADIPAGERGLAQLWWIDKDNNHSGGVDGNDPVIENSSFQIELFNSTDRTLKVGDRVEAYFSRAHYVWQPIFPVETERHFACVQTGWTNTKGAAAAGSWVSEAVSVKTCDYDDASTAAGDAFNVQTMIHKNLDTALFLDYIIEWGLASNGDKVIVSSIWDDPFGTVKWEAVDTANIRDGWALCDGTAGTVDLRRRFIMSIDPVNVTTDGDENTIGDTGGFSHHGPADPAYTPVEAANNHDKHTDTLVAAAVASHPSTEVAAALDDHGVHDHNQTGSDTANVVGGTGFAEVPGQTGSNNQTLNHTGVAGGTLPLDHDPAAGDHDLDHTDSDNRPRYYVLAAIQRFE